MAHPGVVDEDVHGPAALYDLGHQPLALVGRAEVGGDGDGAGQVADERGQALLTAGGHDDGRAGGVEHAGEALAQPARGAGDEGDLAVEPERGQRIDGEGGGG